MKKQTNIKEIETSSLPIIIDKKILPLFSTPILLKKISLKKKNKFLSIPQKKLIYEITTLNNKLVKFDKSIKKYNIQFKKFILNHNKLEMILFFTKDDYLKLIFNLKNIFFKIKKLIPVFKYNSFS